MDSTRTTSAFRDSTGSFRGGANLKIRNFMQKGVAGEQATSWRSSQEKQLMGILLEHVCFHGILFF